jgi:hypothetical protein
VSKEARGVFNHVVGQIVTKAREDDIEDSFSRRLAFTTYKYGLAYHILSGKTDDVIGPEDLAQGAQLVALHLTNLRKVLALYEVPGKPSAKAHPPMSDQSGDIESPATLVATELPITISAADKLNLVVAYLQKHKAANASPITLSKLQGNIRALRGKGQGEIVRTLAKQAIEQDPSLAAFVVIP